MKVAEIIDEHLAKPHGNRQGLSYGELAVLLLTYIVSEGDHRICCLEKWVCEHQNSLEGITGWSIREKEATDDRCGDLLRILGLIDPQTEQQYQWQERWLVVKSNALAERQINTLETRLVN